MINAIRTRLHEDEEGFTLIELLVVVIIIGILAAIAVPTFLNQREKAGQSAAKADIRNAAIAQESYFTENGSYAADNAALGAQLKTSGGVTLVTIGSGTTYCISATHTNMVAPAFYRLLHTEGSPTAHTAQCAAATG